jgi:hypothetical protein
MTGPAVVVRDDRAHLTFDRFDLDAYQTFLAVKALPEHQIGYDWRTDSYHVSTPARYVGRLSGAAVPISRDWNLAPHLYDYQDFIVRLALDAKRFAAWCDTGLGKTAVFLEWARQVVEATGGKVLIFSPLQIIPQTLREAERFYQDLEITRLGSREALAEWCKTPGAGIAICNYEKLIAGPMPELRFLAGVAADESSIFRSGGGVIKWNAIKSCKGIEYKLSCTATPAPNDTMEYASQASFLEKLRAEGEVLWTYFTRDKRGDWRVKPHARSAFYRFMAGWSIYMRDPKAFGFTDILKDLPDPVIREYGLPMTADQQFQRFTLTEAKGGLFNDDRLGVKERVRLSQVAKGFLYEPGSKSQRWTDVPSEKPGFVAQLVRDEVQANRQTIVWTVFDEESRIIQRLLPDIRVAVLDGSMSDEARAEILERFRAGEFDCLISKAQLVGYGLNLQFCKAMVFSGFDDSFERMYQAIRRCYRHGQTEPVHVHVPYIPELEGMVFSNVKRKERQFLSDVAECEVAYQVAMKEVYG